MKKYHIILSMFLWVSVRFATYPEIVDFLNTLNWQIANTAKITTSFGDYIVIYDKI